MTNNPKITMHADSPLPLSQLTALSPIDGRYAEKAAALRAFCSEYALIRYRVHIEIEWLLTLSGCPDILECPTLPVATQELLRAIVIDFSPQEAAAVKALEKNTNHDVKAVEYYLINKINKFNQSIDISSFIHFACTSEDINNLSYALMLKASRDEVLLPAMGGLIEALTKHAKALSALPMLARTHGQSASPTTMGKELAVFAKRLQRQYQGFAEIQILGKLNGAVGCFNAHQVAYPELDWPTLSADFVGQLGLLNNEYTTQIEPHDYMAEYFHALARFNTVLLDFCRDIWGYIALGYFKQRAKASEVGSSTMPHKINPIDFENAEGNLVIANGMLQTMAEKLPISRWQRDLSDSTVLRNIGVGLAHTLLALQACARGMDKLQANKVQIQAELDLAWEVLAEPVQMVMRRYHIPTPYEKLKDLTRGKDIDKETLHEFINSLDIPMEAKQRLLNLTPRDYIGYAVQQALALG